MTSQPVIKAEGVEVQFRAGKGMFGRGRLHALAGADLSVDAGETVALVGESGCGKSTLTRVLVGLQQPTSGVVRLDGDDLWGLSPRARRSRIGTSVGMIFQDPSSSLNRRLPVRRIVRDPLDVHAWKRPPDRDARVRELLAMVGLPQSSADAVPGELSGGQRQRVAIARALALEPSVLVADEPTSALDVSVRAQILNLLMDLKSSLGLAIVFVTHDILTARRISDRLVTMYLGRTVESGPARLAPEASRHPYTRALFAAAPRLLTPPRPIPLPGPVPSAVNPPSGCPFHPRCWRASKACLESFPEPSVEPGGHVYQCVHPVRSNTDLPYRLEPQ